MAMTANKIDEMVKIGREAIAVQDPNIIDYVYLLAYTIRDKELFGANASFAHAAEVVEFSNKAIQLIEAGKTPGVVPADKWNQKTTLSWLYQNIAVVEANNKNSDKALDLFKKSGDLDPTNPYNFLRCGLLYREKYSTAVQEFQALPAEQRENLDANPAAKAKLDQLNGHADKVIDCWARYVAIAKSIEQYKSQVEQVEKNLVELYKYRHPDSPDGLEKLIQQLKNNPPNTSGR
jgi:tetratricopeptide (TPR) repeat protein